MRISNVIRKLENQIIHYFNSSSNPKGTEYYSKDLDRAFLQYRSTKYKVEMLRYMLTKVTPLTEPKLQRNLAFVHLYQSLVQKIAVESSSLANKIYQSTNYDNIKGLCFIDLLKQERINLKWDSTLVEKSNGNYPKDDYYWNGYNKSKKRWTDDWNKVSWNTELKTKSEFKKVTKKFRKKFSKLKVLRNEIAHEFDILVKTHQSTNSNSTLKINELIKLFEEIGEFYDSFYNVFYPNSGVSTQIEEITLRKKIDNIFAAFII